MITHSFISANCFSHVWLFVTLWTVACQAPLSMGFSRQEYWSGLPCPPPEDLPDPGIEPSSFMTPALAGGFFTTSATWEAKFGFQRGGQRSPASQVPPRETWEVDQVDGPPGWAILFTTWGFSEYCAHRGPQLLRFLQAFYKTCRQESCLKCVPLDGSNTEGKPFSVVLVFLSQGPYPSWTKGSSFVAWRLPGLPQGSWGDFPVPCGQEMQVNY